MSESEIQPKLTIETHLGGKGHGSIELNPMSYEEAQTVVKDLDGVSQVGDREDKNGGTITYGYEHIDGPRLDSETRKIKVAFQQIGTEVSVREKQPKKVPQPAQARNWGRQLIKRSRSEHS
jgi:hypothetical protein